MNGVSYVLLLMGGGGGAFDKSANFHFCYTAQNLPYCYLKKKSFLLVVFTKTVFIESRYLNSKSDSFILVPLTKNFRVRNKELW